MCRSLSHPALASFLPSPRWGPVLGVGLVYKNLSWMRPAPEGGEGVSLPLWRRSQSVKRMLSRSLVLNWGKFPHPPGDSWQGGRHQPVERGKPASRGWRPAMLGAAPPHYPVPPVEPGVGGGPGAEQGCWLVPGLGDLWDLRVCATWWSGKQMGVGVGARTPVPVSQKDRVLEGWVPLCASPTAQGLHPRYSATESSSCAEKFTLPDHILTLSSSASKNQEGKAFVPILQMQLVRPGQEQRAQNCPHLLPPPTTGLLPPASPDLGPPERVQNL